MNATNDLLTVSEAAAFLRLKPSTIRAWVLKRKLKFIKLGRRAVRFRRSDLEVMIANGVQETDCIG